MSNNKTDNKPKVEGDTSTTTKEATVNSSANAVDTIEAFEKKFLPLINQKMKAGLTREKAINVIRTQIKEDPAIAEAQLKACQPKK